MGWPFSQQTLNVVLLVAGVNAVATGGWWGLLGGGLLGLFAGRVAP